MFNEYSDVIPIVVNDTAITKYRGFLITVAGPIVITMWNGSVRTLTLPVGIYPFKVKQFKTGTTATVFGLL